MSLRLSHVALSQFQTFICQILIATFLFFSRRRLGPFIQILMVAIITTIVAIVDRIKEASKKAAIIKSKLILF